MKKKGATKKPGLLGQAIMIALMMLAGGTVGFMVARYADTLLEGGAPKAAVLWTFIPLIAAMYFFMLIQIILHEAGHLLGGLMTGYRFLSFRVGSYMWEKGPDGKIRFGRFSLAGTGGQCLMSPPDQAGGNFPYVIYNAGGVAMNLLLAALFGLAAWLLREYALATLLCSEMALVGLAFGLMNGIPLQIGAVDNDGRNILSIGRSSDAKQAFWLQMKINEQSAWGLRLKDMPDAWFPTFTEDASGNSMVTAAEVLSANRLLDSGDFAAAEKSMRRLVGRGKEMPGIYRNLMINDLAYLELIAGRAAGNVEALQSPAMKKFIQSMKLYPSVLRTQFAEALLLDKDPAKAADVRARFDKMALSYPHQSEIDSEMMLMDIAQACHDGPSQGDSRVSGQC